MADEPKGVDIICPACNTLAAAIIPKGTRLADEEEEWDGKVWVNCHDCGEKFHAYYRSS